MEKTILQVLIFKDTPISIFHFLSGSGLARESPTFFFTFKMVQPQKVTKVRNGT